jgi:hypothetical protein
MVECDQRLELNTGHKSCGCGENDLSADGDPTREPRSDDALTRGGESGDPVVLSSRGGPYRCDFCEGAGYCQGTDEGEDAVSRKSAFDTYAEGWGEVLVVEETRCSSICQRCCDNAAKRLPLRRIKISIIP